MSFPGMLSGESPMDMVMKVAHQSHVYKLGLYFERAAAGLPSAVPAVPAMLGSSPTVELGPFTARNGYAVRVLGAVAPRAGRCAPR